MSRRKKIIVIQTGGTISSTGKGVDEYYGSPDRDIFDLIEKSKHPEIEIEMIPASKTISHELGLKEIGHLIHIAKNFLMSDDVFGIVLVCGTNALEDIAYLFGLAIKSDKPIVFTGANFPRDSVMFDGKFNLYNSIVVASSEQMKKQGVVISLNGKVVIARNASKTTPGFLDDFNAHGHAGIGEVLGGYLKLAFYPNYRHTYKTEFSDVNVSHISVPPIVYATLGLCIDALKAQISQRKSKGIILAGFGKGYITKEISNYLKKEVDSGSVIVRCPRISYCFTSTDPIYDEKYGLISGNGLSPQKACILLALCLDRGFSKKEIARVFEEY